MAPTYIPVNEASRLGAEVSQAARQTRTTLENLQHLKEVMDAMVDVGDYSMIAAQFGCSPGNAQALYNLVAGTLAAVKSAATANFIARLG